MFTFSSFQTEPGPEKSALFGAFDKVETNVPDFFGVENGRL